MDMISQQLKSIHSLHLEDANESSVTPSNIVANYNIQHNGQLLTTNHPSHLKQNASTKRDFNQQLPTDLNPIHLEKRAD